MDIYYAKYYGKGGGRKWSAGEKIKMEKKRRNITVKKGKRP